MFTKVFMVVLGFLAFANCDSRINFVFFHDAGISEYTTTNIRMILSHPSFLQHQQTVMFHYGTGQNLVTPEVNDVVTAYRAIKNYNFIVVHYPDSSDIGSLSASGLGDSIGDALINLFNSGYNSGFMNLVGFSIGAQIMGRASRRVQSRTNRRHIIGRLTGLDPWDLGIISSVTVGRLSSADAQLVDTVHTEGNSRGDHESQGHVAFMVNGGVVQPFCDQTLPSQRADCSHIFALSVWAESVRSPVPIFPALQCSTWNRYIGGECDNNDITNLGRIAENLMERGTFFLRTNHQSPFSRDSPFP